MAYQVMLQSIVTCLYLIQIDISLNTITHTTQNSYVNLQIMKTHELLWGISLLVYVCPGEQFQNPGKKKEKKPSHIHAKAKKLYVRF